VSDSQDHLAPGSSGSVAALMACYQDALEGLATHGMDHELKQTTGGPGDVLLKMQRSKMVYVFLQSDGRNPFHSTESFFHYSPLSSFTSPRAHPLVSL
jgi:hypothetical protein